MSQPPIEEPADRPWYVLGPDDPPIDFSREEAAYDKEAERLARDHLGKIALVHEDEVVGVFNDPDDALEEACRRFGDEKVMMCEIRDPKAPLDFIGLVDPNHPCCKSVDKGGNVMSQQPASTKSANRPWPVLGPNDPPLDFSREDAAYSKEAERLARDHLGKIALVHEDEVVGVFNDPDEAFDEADRRFGNDLVMVRVIRDPKAPLDFVSLVDPNHPCCKSVGKGPSGAHGEIHG